MWTTRILKSAATIAIISAFTQARAGENATCYVNRPGIVGDQEL